MYKLLSLLELAKINGTIFMIIVCKTFLIGYEMKTFFSPNFVMFWKIIKKATENEPFVPDKKAIFGPVLCIV